MKHLDHVIQIMYDKENIKNTFRSSNICISLIYHGLSSVITNLYQIFGFGHFVVMPLILKLKLQIDLPLNTPKQT